MNFKDLLKKDAKAFTNSNEFGDTAHYNGNVLNCNFDILENQVPMASFSTEDIYGIAKGDILTIQGIDYKVIDTESLKGITNILMNEA